MKKIGPWVCFVILLISAHRLPAPISEVPEPSHAPSLKREAVRSKREIAPRPTARPDLSFAGTWTGTTITKLSKGADSSSTYIIRISDDEKTVWINWGSQQPTGAGHQAPANRSRETLSWSLTLRGLDLNVIDAEMSEYQVMDTLRMNANGTASFVREGRYPFDVNFWTGVGPGITFKCTGTLSRQDASSAPSISQTTTTTVAPQTAGIPTAKLVPNKPGFVFNPFDPNTKQILDVRGRASGTKVKDPSGKLFIVP